MEKYVLNMAQCVQIGEQFHALFQDYTYIYHDKNLISETASIDSDGNQIIEVRSVKKTKLQQLCEKKNLDNFTAKVDGITEKIPVKIVFTHNRAFPKLL